MSNFKIILSKYKKIIRVSWLVLLCFNESPALAQVISTHTIQDMRFGAFSQGGSGGTISVSNSGSRSVTGSVLALNLGSTYHQAIFEVEATATTVVSISNGPDVTLTGSNGGTMSLHIGNSDPSSPFISTVVPPGRTQVKIGGTLTVGNSGASPPGSYTGTMYITFNNE